MKMSKIVLNAVPPEGHFRGKERPKMGFLRIRMVGIERGGTPLTGFDPIVIMARGGSDVCDGTHR